MNKFFKSTYVLLMGLLGLGLASCTDEYEYHGAVAEGMEVYFSNELESQIELVDGKNSFTIPVNRVNAAEATTVPLTFTPGEGNIYNVPTSVTFEAGQKEANITVTYDAAGFKYGNYVGGTISIGDDTYKTPYGMSAYTFKAGITPFKVMEGVGYYRDGIALPAYGLPVPTYKVKIEKHTTIEGVYRLKPYGAATSEFQYSGNVDPAAESYMEIHAEDPNFVYFLYGRSGMTLNKSDGELYFMHQVERFLKGGNKMEDIKAKAPQFFGKLKNGIITFSEPNSVALFINGTSGTAYNTNAAGMLAIALPGHEFSDYSASATYMGRFTDASSNDFAKVQIALGADVKTAKYALVSASSMTEEQAVAGVKDGSIESKEITASGDVEVPFTNSGEYYMVIVLYDAAGNVQGAVVEKFTLKSSKDSTEQFKDIYKGLLTIADPAGDLGPKVLEGGVSGLLFKNKLEFEATLSQSTADPNKYRISPYLQEGFPLEFTVTSGGFVIVKLLDTGIKAKDGQIFVSDFVTLYPAVAGKGFESTFDKANQTIKFNMIYTNASGKGVYGVETETFLLDEALTKQIAKSMKKAPTFNLNSMLKKHYIVNVPYFNLGK